MLAFATIRHRKAGFAGAFVALLCAAALVCACGILLDTGLRGTIAPERYAGTPTLVSGDQYVHALIHKKKGKVKHKAKPISDRAWVPAAVADRLGTVPGVRKVVTEVTFPAYLPGGRQAESWGHGWESAPLTPVTLEAGRAPNASDEIVVTPAASLAPGETTSVLNPQGRATYRVVGVTEQTFKEQDAVYFATAEARRLAGHPGAYSVIGVFPGGVDVRKVLAGATVHTGSDRGKIEFLGADNARIKLISMGGALGGTALLVAILVVAGTFALSIQQRQRELALLRAIGATPRQVRRLVTREALLVGLAAAGPGALGGVALAFWLRTRFVALGAMPPNLDLVVSPFPVLAAVGAALVAAWAAAWLSARRGARIRPVEALGEAALIPPGLPWPRLLAGLGTLAGSVVLTFVLSGLSTDAAAAPVTLLTALLWTVVVALLGPVLARAALTLLGGPLRASRSTGYLAAANLRVSARRLASVITPLTLLVALAGTILFTQTTLGHAAAEQTRAGIRAEHVAGPRVPVAAFAAVRRLHGVRAVTAVKHTTVRAGLTKLQAQGVTPEGLAATMDLDVRSGTLTRLGPGTMAVRTGLGMRVGDRVRLALGDGTPVTPEVIATYARGLGFGDLTLDRDLVAAHVDEPFDDALLISAPGESRQTVAAALKPYAGVLGKDEVAAQRQSEGAAVTYVSLGLIIAFAAIAAVNTLALATADRAREFALLRLVGTTRRQILRMLGWETLVVAGLSMVLGSAIVAVTLSAYSSGMTGSVRPYVTPLTGLAVLAVAAGLAAVATRLPARLALRVHPAEAIAE